MSEQRRRVPGLGIAIAVGFLILPIAGVAWWLNRSPGGDPSGGRGLADLDVVCLGRVDGMTPIASLEPTIPGRVGKVYVLDGQPVKAGDELLRLDDETLKLKEQEAQAYVTSADLEIEAARLEETTYPLKKAAQKSALAAAGQRLTAARKILDEKKAAQKFGTVTTAELIAAESEIRQLEHLEEVEQSRLKEIDAGEGAVRLKVKAAESRKTLAAIALKQAQKTLADSVLTAPSSGVVLRVQTSRGESVVPGGIHPPIVFRPDSRLVVRAELEQEFLGRVKPGMKANIRDDARADSPTWTGTVERVGNWVTRKRSVLLDPGEMNDVRTVECVLVLDGNPDGLLIGQRMRVRIGKAE